MRWPWRARRRWGPRRCSVRPRPRAAWRVSWPARPRSAASCAPRRRRSPPPRAPTRTPTSARTWRGAAVVGDAADPHHVIIRATADVLENFREGYQVAARTVGTQRDWPIAERTLVQKMRRQFATSLLLGEVRKPEGNSVIIFGNALSRL